MQLKTIPIILENTKMLSPKVKHFIFRTPENAPFDYRPGQFITIHFERDGKKLLRSYSIANPPEQDNKIEFAAGFVEQGPGTELLFNLQKSDVININGPFGRLILKDDIPSRYILVATSTGVTPYRAMIPELKRRLDENPHLSIVILLGVQTREDILYRDEFIALANLSPRISFQAHLSRQPQEDIKAPYEHSGYVQAAFPALELDPEQDRVYLCGNPAMIDEAFAYLKEKNFPMQHIVREKYISN